MGGLDTEQAFILGEMVRFLEHPTSGVRRFDQMNPEWRGLVLGVRSEAMFKRSSPEIEKTVASWFQEERDICLILNRRITKRVALRLTRKYKLDPELRLRKACDRLIESQELRSVFTIQDAANDLEVTANLQRADLVLFNGAEGPEKQAAGQREDQLAPSTAETRRERKCNRSGALARQGHADSGSVGASPRGRKVSRKRSVCQPRPCDLRSSCSKSLAPDFQE